MDIIKKKEHKRPARTVTAAQKRKIKEFQKRIEEENRARQMGIPKDAEIRC